MDQEATNGDPSSWWYVTNTFRFCHFLFGIKEAKAVSINAHTIPEINGLTVHVICDVMSCLVVTSIENYCHA